MKLLDHSRHALSLGVAALLAACGASQPPIGAPGAMPQSPAIATQGERGGSWMLPGATGSDLLYVSELAPNGGRVKVYSYPQRKTVGQVNGLEAPFGLCSDSNGHVFVVDQETQDIVEYAHGGTSPIATLSDVGYYPIGCSVDPMTNDLAVAGDLSTVSIFTNGSGVPTRYTDSQVRSFSFCSYDDNGDLFVVGQRTGNFDDTGVLEEVVHGSGTLSPIAVNQKFNGFGSVQWVDHVLNIDNALGQKKNKDGPSMILRVKVSGSKGTVISAIELASGGHKSRNPGYGVEYWIQGSTIMGPESADGNIEFWPYPHGGEANKTIFTPRAKAYGVTLSVAPSQRRSK